jgi:hypothetical protein
MRTDLACVEAVKTAVAKGGEADRQRGPHASGEVQEGGNMWRAGKPGSQRQIEFPKKLWKTA